VQPKLLTDENELPQTENPLEEMDDLNIRLIRELQRNARQKAWVLARRLGVSRPTVSKRMQGLIETGVIRIITSIDPFALGYEVMANIGLKCEPARVKEVAKAVVSFRNVQYVAICAGRYDISTWVAFRKLSDLRHFITVELAGIPGLKDTETTINHKLIKAVEGYAMPNH
jgi:Lrp/AsnC family transcriptional regulator, regulator for asnA, asnC and gidA